MCGIVGLHLRTPELYPRLGELLTGMLCEMSNRGSDSAGVAVYGDPVWTPPGRGCVSLLDVGADTEAIGIAVGSALGGDVDRDDGRRHLPADRRRRLRGVARRCEGRPARTHWSPGSVPIWRCSRAWAIPRR